MRRHRRSCPTLRPLSTTGRLLRAEVLEDRRLLYHTYFDEGHTTQALDDQLVTYSYSNLLTNWGSGLTIEQMHDATQEAMGAWASTTPLHFEERVDAGAAVSDLDILTEGAPIARWGEHAIDGNSGVNVLAHAYPPNSGLFPNLQGRDSDIHFDNGNAFSFGTFLEVATHEAGHAIGMDHANGDVVNGVIPPPTPAVMDAGNAGLFSGPGSAFLFDDDRLGITSLYGNGLGYVLNFGGGLHVYGTGNGDVFTVNISGGNVTVTNAENSAWGTRSFTRSMTGVTGVFIHGQGGNDSITVGDNDSHTPVFASGDAGDDTFSVQSVNRDFDRAAAVYSFTGGAGADFANLFDDTNFDQRTYNITNNSVSRFAGGTVFSFNYDSSLEVAYLATGLLFDTVVIDSTSASTHINIASSVFGDAFSVGNGSLAGIQGSLYLGTGGQFKNSTLSINDSSRSAATSAFLGGVDAAPGTPAYGFLTGPSAQISWAFSGMSAVNYLTGVAANTITVERAGSVLQLGSVGGDDNIYLGTPTKGVGLITQEVQISSAGGAPNLVIDDSAATAAKNFTLTSDAGGFLQKITDLAPTSIRFGALRSLTVTLGSGNDSANLYGSLPYAVSIATSAGDDLLHLFNVANNLPGGAAAYNFNFFGGSGNDYVWASDESRSGAFNYVYGTTLLSGTAADNSAAFYVNVSDAEQGVLGLNDERNQVDVNSTPVGFNGLFSGGLFMSLNGGHDVVKVKPRTATGAPSLLGEVVFDGGVGADTLTMDDSASATGANWLINNPNASNDQSFTVLGGAGVRITNITGPTEYVELIGTAAGDLFTVVSYRNGGSLSISANDGDDRFQVGQDLGLLSPGDPGILLDGGTGHDEAFIENRDSTVAWTYTRDIVAGGSVLVAQSGSQQVFFTDRSVEYLSATGGLQNDQFFVLGTRSGTIMNLDGAGGSDSFLFGNPTFANPSRIAGPVYLSNSDGPESVLIQDPNGPATVVHVDDLFIGKAAGDNLFQPGGFVYIGGLDGTLTLQLGSAGNTVYARPSAALALSLSSSDAATVDTLNLGLAGIANPIFAPGGTSDAGTYSFSNAASIQYAGFAAKAVDSTAPHVVSQRFDATGIPYFAVQFSESVSAHIASGDLQRVNSFTQLATPALLYDEVSKTAVFTFPSYPNGRPPVGIYALSVLTRDNFGNPVIPSTPLTFEIASTLAGDYDQNGAVDGHDFLVWQRTVAATATPPGHGADGSVNGTVDRPDLTIWENNYGATDGGMLQIAAVEAAVSQAAYSLASSPLNSSASPRDTAFESLFGGGSQSSRRPFRRPGAWRIA